MGFLDFFKRKFTFDEVPCFKLAALAGSLILSGLVVSLIIVSAVKQTSDDKFCGNCHSMTPMVESFLESSHGGKNKHGVKADCVDCHLPKNNTINYMFTKTKLAVHDIFSEIFLTKEKLYWTINRARREEYTYDSGCLSCHRELQESSKPDRKAFIAHKSYFIEEGPSCVSCHESVGHHNLNDFLKKK